MVYHDYVAVINLDIYYPNFVTLHLFCLTFYIKCRLNTNVIYDGLSKNN